MSLLMICVDILFVFALAVYTHTCAPLHGSIAACCLGLVFVACFLSHGFYLLEPCVLQFLTTKS